MFKQGHQEAMFLWLLFLLPPGGSIFPQVLERWLPEVLSLCFIFLEASTEKHNSFSKVPVKVTGLSLLLQMARLDHTSLNQSPQPGQYNCPWGHESTNRQPPQPHGLRGVCFSKKNQSTSRGERNECQASKNN